MANPAPDSRLLASHRRAFEPGEIILRQGEMAGALFVIEEGTVRVAADTAPEATTLALLGPGDVFGEASMFAHEGVACRTVAATKVHTLNIDAESLEGLVLEVPEVACRLLAMLSARLSASERLIEILLQRDVRTRVVRGLLWRATHMGMTPTHTLSLADFSTSIGLTDAQVERVLEPLQRFGIVQRTANSFSVQDLGKLEEFRKLLELNEGSVGEARR